MEDLFLDGDGAEAQAQAKADAAQFVYEMYADDDGDTMNASTVTMCMVALTGREKKDVQDFFGDLQKVLHEATGKKRKVVLPKVAITLKRAEKPATKQCRRRLFGKKTAMAAKPSKWVVQAVAGKALQNSANVV
jgi:hypothetical protein